MGNIEESNRKLSVNLDELEAQVKKNLAPIFQAYVRMRCDEQISLLNEIEVSELEAKDYVQHCQCS